MYDRDKFYLCIRNLGSDLLVNFRTTINIVTTTGELRFSQKSSNIWISFTRKSFVTTIAKKTFWIARTLFEIARTHLAITSILFPLASTVWRIVREDSFGIWRGPLRSRLGGSQGTATAASGGIGRCPPSSRPGCRPEAKL